VQGKEISAENHIFIHLKSVFVFF